MEILLLLAGLGLILAGASFLTDGSAALAKRLRVPEFIIGLTIVAVGTSTPEWGPTSSTYSSFWASAPSYALFRSRRAIFAATFR